MQCTDFYDLVKRIKRHEQEELEAAVKAHDGNVYFDEENAPIIAVNMDSFEPEPMDVIVQHVFIDSDGYLCMSARGKLDGEDYHIDLDDVFAGHLQYVTCEIPSINGIDDVTLEFKV